MMLDQMEIFCSCQSGRYDERIRDLVSKVESVIYLLRGAL
jgi:hypothetical protein